MKKFICAAVLLAVMAGISWAQEESDASAGTSEDTPAPVHFLNFQILPGMNVFGFGHGFRVTNIFLLSTTIGIGYNITGVASAPVGVITSGHVQGVQLSGFFNISRGNLDGTQVSSLFNVSKGTLRGFQFAGIYNWAQGDMWGIQLAPVNRRSEGEGISVQVGLVNFSDSPNVIPIGLVNNVKGGMKHYYVFADDMKFMNIGYRSGTRIFYSHSSYGFLPGQDDDTYVLARSGVGLEFPLKKFFIDIDYTRGNITSLKTGSVEDILAFFFGSNTSVFQIRLIAGYKFVERFGIFAGVSYDYLKQNKDTDPNPAIFVKESMGKVNGAEGHKIGFFGGVQF